MWAFFIEDRTLLYPAVGVATQQQFGHSETIFSKTVAYSSSSGHPQKSPYVTLNRGYCGLWVRVCALPPRSFLPWYGLRPDFVPSSFPSLTQSLSLSLSLSLSFSYSTEIMWTQELVKLSFLFSFRDRSWLELVPRRCLNAQMDFCKTSTKS